MNAGTMTGGNNLEAWLLGAIPGGGGGGGPKFQAATLVNSAAVSGKAEAEFSTPVTIPADTLAVGDRIEVSAVLDITGVAGSPTFGTGLHFGGNSAVALLQLEGVGATEQGMLRATGIVRSIGASAVISWSYSQTFGNNDDGRSEMQTTNTAVDREVVPTGQWNSSNSSNTAVLLGLVVTVTAEAP